MKAPFSWPKSSRFDEFARNCRHVDGHERPAPPPAIIMKGARHEFLAGAGLTLDHDRQVGLRQPGDDAVDILHDRRAADDRQVLGRRLCGGSGFAIGLLERRGRPVRTSALRSKGFGR